MHKFTCPVILRILAALSGIIAVIWFVATPSYEPLLAVLGGVAALVSSFFVDKPDQHFVDKPDQHLTIDLGPILGSGGKIL